MNNLSRLFQPITSNPDNAGTYIEVLPSSLLRPYIRCFWGTKNTESVCQYDDYASAAVIPDVCMDVIFNVDYLSNNVQCLFCGLNDRPFFTTSNAQISTFAIRFNFWAVHIFSDTHLKGTLNVINNAEEHLSDLCSFMKRLLITKTSMLERIAQTEKYLIGFLNKKTELNNNFMNSVYNILASKGVLPISDICERNIISQRQLERTFLEYTGVTPKKAADLVRFQNIWREIYYTRPITQDMIFRYNFTDQSHFINNFKKFFGKSPLKAKDN